MRRGEPPGTDRAQRRRHAVRSALVGKSPGWNVHAQGDRRRLRHTFLLLLLPEVHGHGARFIRHRACGRETCRHPAAAGLEVGAVLAPMVDDLMRGWKWLTGHTPIPI